ncbi:hypothetical protein [Silvimonas soli]|uniref:hypothetical protein n=1 Tax=Silvimonas soli TaxID=2980100 RepID=UPI0024B3C206|nr:hypothetical protein [Silvimonas soli]
MNPSTTYKVLGSETTPSRVAPTSAGTSLMMAEEQAATWPNGAVIDATLETGITGAEIAASLASAAKSGRITPAGIVGGIVSQFVTQALINQGMKWMADAQAWEMQGSSLVPASYSVTQGSSYTDCASAAGAVAAVLNSANDGYVYTPGNCTYSYQAVAIFVSYRDASGQGGTGNRQGSSSKTVCPAGSTPNGLTGGWPMCTVVNPGYAPAQTSDFQNALNQSLNADQTVPTWSKAFNDASAASPDTNVAQSSRPQVVTVNTPTQTSTPQQTSSTTTSNPDGSTTTSTTTSSTTTTASPSGSTVNNTSTNVNSTTTNITNTNNSVTGTTTSSTTTADAKPAPDPTPTSTPDPVTLPAATQFPPVPSPTPVPDGTPAAQTSFLSWSPFTSFSFVCTDPTVPILDKNVSIPLCQWIDKIRVFFFWFWNVATAIGIYLLGRGFNINTASAKTEE